jgi:CDP-diacylglycerol pyrophosphatase
MHTGVRRAFSKKNMRVLTSTMRKPSRIALLAAVLLLIAGLFAGAILAVQAHERGLLWRVVQLCVADQLENGRPRPCSYVSLVGSERRGYVVLDDPLSREQVLVMPTRRIPGIESLELVSVGAPNYLQAAWHSRTFVFRRLRQRLPRDDIGLAINSAPDRSQDQLHIHVDCLQPGVRQEIDSHAETIGTTWMQLGFNLAGRRYWARRVEASNLRGINPFRLLSDWVTANNGAMWRETLVIAGVTFAGHRDGFVLLADTADPPHGNPGHGEFLLDHACTLANS